MDPMDLSDELLTIAARHEDGLGSLFWASERDRWAELPFCILNAFIDDPQDCRALTAMLYEAGLLEPGVLAMVDDADDESAAVLRRLLLRYGFDPHDIDKVLGCLASISGAIAEQYQGKIQRYLRHQAEVIRDDLLGMCDGAVRSDLRLRRAVTHWLQNALGAPLSLGDEAVLEFCAERGISLDDLEDAADHADFNLALVDDVIGADRNTRRKGAADDE